MRTKLTFPLLAILALGALGCSSSGSEPETMTPSVRPGVDMSMMQDECGSRAAEKYNQKPSNIQLMPTKQNGDEFYVDGQYPPKSRDATRFRCTFSSDGEFKRIRDN